MRKLETPTLAFGPFRLETDDRLHRHGVPVALPPKELAVLRVLLEADGSIVRKEELLRRVWPGVSVSDASLTRCVYALRTALGGEAGRQGPYVETVHGRGYRFAAPVIVRRARRTGGVAEHRVLVTPFVNASGKPDDEYLCAGLTEELIHALGRRCPPGARVIARVSAMRCKDRDPIESASELAAELVVTGRLRRGDGAIDVSAELVRSDDAVELWSERFTASDSAGLAARIAEALAARLPGATPHSVDRRPGDVPANVSARAHNAYLEGRFSAALRTEAGLRRAIERYRQAAEWEPGFAQAHAAIAETLMVLAFRGFVATRDAAPIARAALERAFAIEPELPMALAALGYLELRVDRDPVRAEAVLRRALALEPGQWMARMLVADLLVAQRRFDESVELERAALELDPFNPTMRSNLATTLVCAGRFDEARAVAYSLAASEPQFALAHALEALAALETGRRAEAIEAAARAKAVAAGESLSLAVAAYVDARCERTDEARAVLAELERIADERRSGAYDVAAVYVGLDEPERALEWLRRADAELDLRLQFLDVDPRFARLRGDPRFRDLVRSAFGGLDPAALAGAAA